MSRIVVSLAEARPDQIREFLQTIKGVETTGKEDAGKLRAMLQNVAYMEEFITVPDTRTLSGAPNDGRPTMQRRPVSPERQDADGNLIHEIRIILQTSDKAGGDEPVPVGLNGMVMLIPRGEPVWVREEYVAILGNAAELVYEEYDQTKNMLGGLSDPRLVPAYPYSYA